MLTSLRVIDRLEVGPVKLEPKRLSMPYRVTREGQTSEQELVYAYETAVFDPAEPAALNLAALAGAQLALNYGLFCREIVFHGLFDPTDQRFLRDMMDNTSREIYVNKFLKPNVFLVGEAAHLPVERRRSYTQAEVRFVQTGPLPAWEHWRTDPHRPCILSSGGKDSLLSYGLMRELGYEPHPIFVNESGRHWFTALNAYRYQRAHEPHTGRVWTNSDRLFAWMLRHLPFVRPDFASVRADDYPIRLWTVAVFLFGVLPLMRQRGLGRLLIGDEYDTTRRSTYQGITDYEGLYDQSRYFDEALSRFFLKKGWQISQFSILRPVSELVIQAMLAKRYPDLQAQQVSCHATHQVEDRIRPCGKCEKCRRIVGMLTVHGEDPARCGYRPEQVTACLKALETRGVKQIGPDARHLQWLLHQQGAISLPAEAVASLKPHPETEMLRFDAERSPFASIPRDLRRPLYRIYLEHTQGAVKREGRQWQPTQVLDEPALDTPYPFEVSRQVVPAAEPARPKGPLWAELTWPEAKARLAQTDIALLPTGAIEQHGPHLPLDIDAFDAAYLARRVAEACAEPQPLVLPLVPYGVSYHHDDFPGTISVSNDALSRFIYEIGMSLARQGIRKLIIINGHGDNAPTLNYAAQMINRDAGIFVAVDTGDSSDVDLDALCETPNDVHAGEIETSTALATRPHLVYMDQAAPSVPNFSNRYLNFSSRRSVPWYVRTARISESGVLGDPTRASAEKGRKMWEIMIAHLVALVESLRGDLPGLDGGPGGQASRHGS